MNKNQNKRISKLLSLTLRHAPESLGVRLDANGWCNVDQIIDRVNRRKGYYLDKKLLVEIVETNDKKRFSFNADQSMIRANQGHSIAVNLGLQERKPEQSLYHGTIQTHIGSIFKIGLQKQQRHHVHLSADIQTAMKVGMRHGKPVILEVNALQMVNDGISFYLSDNGVWLTDEVLPKYLTIREDL